MKKIWVDFNDRDERWLVPTLAKFSEGPVFLGEEVMAGDHEGNRCRALVAEIDTNLGIVYLELEDKAFVAAESAGQVSS